MHKERSGRIRQYLECGYSVRNCAKQFTYVVSLNFHNSRGDIIIIILFLQMRKGRSSKLRSLVQGHSQPMAEAGSDPRQSDCGTCVLPTRLYRLPHTIANSGSYLWGGSGLGGG